MPTRTPPRPKLPAALARRAAALTRARDARLVARGKADVALVREKQREIASAFYEMGQALVRLSDKAVIRALGHASFEALLSARVGLSVEQAERLIVITEQITEADAIDWKMARSYAVADLKRQPGVRALGAHRLQLPSGQAIDVGRTSTAVLAREVASIRRARQSKDAPRRGRTTSPEERRDATELERALAALHVTARVRCVATRPGQPSDVTVRFSATSLPVVLERLHGRRAQRS